MNIIKIALAVVASTIALSAAPQTADADIKRKNHAEWSKWDACPTIDGFTTEPPCVWDARHRGDGTGPSFVVRMDGSIHEIRHALAHCRVQWHGTGWCRVFR